MEIKINVNDILETIGNLAKEKAILQAQVDALMRDKEEKESKHKEVK